MTQVTCSFCGRKKKDVDLMVSGIHAHICNYCIDQAFQILQEEKKTKEVGDKPSFNLIKPKEMKEYLDLGLHIGITGILTIKGRGKDLRKFVRLLPVERIMIETDAPYLTPAPEKNQTRRNEPAFVKSVLLKLAEVRQEDPEYLAGRIWENTCRLYDIEL